jgi:hypothetical protein
MTRKSIGIGFHTDASKGRRGGTSIYPGRHAWEHAKILDTIIFRYGVEKFFLARFVRH